ncbi:MAG: hypothetical protein ACTSWY_13805 [Promethearchaeota archaeon]
MKLKKYIKLLLESPEKIIQIYGPAGLGKSTIAITLVKSILANNNGLSIWIDTEKKFSKKRFGEISYFGKNFSDFSSVLVSNPQDMEEQQENIESLNNNKFMTSGKIKVNSVTLDSASFFFRGSLYKDNWVQYSDKFHAYYENHILPLLMFQKKTDCYLILVHQVSDNPKTGETKPFMFNIFKEISSVWVELQKEIDKSYYYLNTFNQTIHQKCTYNLSDSGIEVIS